MPMTPKFDPGIDMTPVRFMTFSANDDSMSEFAVDDFEVSDAGTTGGDIFGPIRATENSKLSNQKQVKC